MISDSVLLTNNHLIESEDTANALVLELGYDYDSDGREAEPVTLSFDPKRLFYTSADAQLDFTVVAIAENGTNESQRKHGHLPLIARTGKVKNGDPLNVVHHPGGGRKKVTIRSSRLTAIDESTVSYSGDTLGGSSGSPVLNDQWEVVALHYGGKPKLDRRKRELTVDGQLWNDQMSDSMKAYEFNVGARVSCILADLARRRPRESEKKRLLSSILNGGSS